MDGAAKVSRGSRARAWFWVGLTNIALTVVVIAAAELVARQIEFRSQSTLPPMADDPELGWAPPPGVIGTVITQEFTVTHYTNELGLFDDPVDGLLDRAGTRILALGDSHTMATGVAPPETWPNALEQMLFGAGRREGTVINAGVGGYSLGQELVRMRQLQNAVRPGLVLIGFSTATDFYDVVPPQRGGFVYGAQKGRVYFDFDDRGKLTEHRELVGKRLAPEERNPTTSLRLRNFLGRFALYRAAKRSQAAMSLAMWLQPATGSLWPGLDTALKIQPSEDDAYRIELVSQILAQIAVEAKRSGSEVVLVHIPYLAQVYDEVWAGSFGMFPEQYDRELGSKRLRQIADEAGMGFVDTSGAFVREARRTGAWLHYPHDGHPTPAGHRIIAKAVAEFLLSEALLPAGTSAALIEHEPQ
jgi:lysophospholipase L1-like esterase